jgi:hypothetical protein
LSQGTELCAGRVALLGYPVDSNAEQVEDGIAHVAAELFDGARTYVIENVRDHLWTRSLEHRCTGDQLHGDQSRRVEVGGEGVTVVFEALRRSVPKCGRGGEVGELVEVGDHLDLWDAVPHDGDGSVGVHEDAIRRQRAMAREAKLPGPGRTCIEQWTELLKELQTCSQPASRLGPVELLEDHGQRDAVAATVDEAACRCIAGEQWLNPQNIGLR